MKTHNSITLTPTVLSKVADEAIDARQTVSSYVNGLLLTHNIECKHKRILDDFQAWLVDLVEKAHVTKEHHIEWAVVLHELTKRRNK